MGFPWSRPQGSARDEAFWWVNATRVELRETLEAPASTSATTPPANEGDKIAAVNVRENAEQAKSATPKDKEGKKLERVTVSAISLLPLGYATIAILGAWSSLVACINGFYARGITFFFTRNRIRGSAAATPPAVEPS